MLPTDRDARNALPVWDGCMAYFPDCWAEIAKVSVLGNKQHALGEKLRFARDVSTDHANKVMRHMLDHAAGITFDEDGTYHLAKAAWRALAALQVAIEKTPPRKKTETFQPVVNVPAPSLQELTAQYGPPTTPWAGGEYGGIQGPDRVVYETPEHLRTPYGEVNQQNPQCDPRQEFRAAGSPIPNRGQEPCAKRPGPSLGERYNERKSEG